MTDIIGRLKEHCVGHPYSKIEWPHRLLHDAMAEIIALRERRDFLLQSNNQFEDRARKAERGYDRLFEKNAALAEKLAELLMDTSPPIYENILLGTVDPLKARPIEEYHEDMGDVLWWQFPITEAPYVGSPLRCGYTVEAVTTILTQMNQDEEPVIARISVGGWPGYHTHFTPIPMPEAP